MSEPVVATLLKHIYEPPAWLATDERITFRTTEGFFSEATADSLTIHATVERSFDGQLRVAEHVIPGWQWVSMMRRGEKGAIVDRVVMAYEDLMLKLEPPMPQDEIACLMLGAFGDDQICDVLVDAGLEQGVFEPLRWGIGRRADVRTDEEKQRDARADLRMKARKWARPYVELLIRRNWSVQSWAE